MNYSLIPLSMLGTGEEAKLVGIQSGWGLKRRLAAMGLNPGMKVTVVQNFMKGPIILKVMDSKIALGRGMAQKILVSRDQLS